MPHVLLLLVSALAGSVQMRVIMPEPAIPPNHTFVWRHQQPGEASVLDQLTNDLKRSQFYYLLTGDTQYWFKCTPENFECHRKTNFCDTGTLECQKAQGDYANNVQKTSLQSLIDQMAGRDVKPKGLIINGDLTQFGHELEMEEYKQHWTLPIRGLTIYPGLGNHDYANNVDSCTVNHCANRMVTWFYKYVRQILKREMDIRKSTEWAIYNTFKGSLAYSWDECTPTGCIHFVQLNNYPTYRTEFKWLLATWQIKSSLNFVHRDLDANIGKQVVINFHDFDSHFNAEDKERFKLLIGNQNYKILAINFAHYHSQVGLHPSGYWCLNQKAVPLFYSGSVPANNYMLAKFDPSEKESAHIYLLHANDQQSTSVQKMPLQEIC